MKLVAVADFLPDCVFPGPRGPGPIEARACGPPYTDPYSFRVREGPAPLKLNPKQPVAARQPYFPGPRGPGPIEAITGEIPRLPICRFPGPRGPGPIEASARVGTS